MSTLLMNGSQCCSKPPHAVREPRQPWRRWLLPALVALLSVGSAALVMAVALVHPVHVGGDAAAASSRSVVLPRVVVHARRLPAAAVACPVPTESVAASCPMPADGGSAP